MHILNKYKFEKSSGLRSHPSPAAWIGTACLMAVSATRKTGWVIGRKIEVMSLRENSVAKNWSINHQSIISTITFSLGVGGIVPSVSTTTIYNHE